MVAIRLRQLYGENVYFYQKGVEVDFYVIDIQLAIQVSYSLLDPDTYKREINGLIKMAAHIEVNEMMIITKDEEKIIAIDGYNIQVIPIWKWLLPGR